MLGERDKGVWGMGELGQWDFRHTPLPHYPYAP
jgi:hypothetical protein